MKSLLVAALVVSASLAFSANTGLLVQGTVGSPEKPASVDEPDQKPVRKSRFATREEMANVAPDQSIRKDNCLRFTGSRLLRDDRDNQRCAIASGRVYYNSDIDQAAAGTMAEILRR